MSEERFELLWRNVLVTLGLLLMLAAPGWAADYVTPTLVYGGMQAADYYSSVHAMRRGGIEAGPVASAVGVAPAKILGSVVLIALDVHLQRKGHKKQAWILRGLTVVGYGLIVAHNSRQGR